MKNFGLGKNAKFRDQDGACGDNGRLTERWTWKNTWPVTKHGTGPDNPPDTL